MTDAPRAPAPSSARHPHARRAGRRRQGHPCRLRADLLLLADAALRSLRAAPGAGLTVAIYHVLGVESGMILSWLEHTRLTLRSIAQRCVSSRGVSSARRWTTSRLLAPFETRQSAGFTPRDSAAPQSEVIRYQRIPLQWRSINNFFRPEAHSCRDRAGVDESQVADAPREEMKGRIPDPGTSRTCRHDPCKAVCGE